jgi:hypothetical protein
VAVKGKLGIPPTDSPKKQEKRKSNEQIYKQLDQFNSFNKKRNSSANTRGKSTLEYEDPAKKVTK